MGVPVKNHALLPETRASLGAVHKNLLGALTQNMLSTVCEVKLPTHKRTLNVSECDPSIKLGSV